MKEVQPIVYSYRYLQIPRVQKQIHLGVPPHPVTTLLSASFPRHRPPEHIQQVLLHFVLSVIPRNHADWTIQS